MKQVYIAADSIYAPLGKTTLENFEAVRNGFSGITQLFNPALLSEPFYASMFGGLDSNEKLKTFTRLERISIKSIEDALSNTDVKLSDKETLFILSTTKGNIELIESEKPNEQIVTRVSLFNTAKVIAEHFNAANRPVVVSNACTSGVLSLIIAKRLLESGKYKHVVITGVDILSRFIISGFKSLNAMSLKPCRPFDKSREGINLGECAATVVLTVEKSLAKNISLLAGASTNDANHISGPSRTGYELSHAINSAMEESGLMPNDLSFISAHGTATLFNDEMEAKAFSRSSMLSVPVHSLKGYFGHTLGAAGVLESVLTYHSLLNRIILPSKNFEEHGVNENIFVSTSLQKSDKPFALKTASGFGGCNAAIIFSAN